MLIYTRLKYLKSTMSELNTDSTESIVNTIKFICKICKNTVHRNRNFTISGPKNIAHSPEVLMYMLFAKG